MKPFQNTYILSNMASARVWSSESLHHICFLQAFTKSTSTPRRTAEKVLKNRRCNAQRGDCRPIGAVPIDHPGAAQPSPANDHHTSGLRNKRFSS